MKTLFLSTSDIVGGAARATHWLAKGLRSIGQEVSLIAQQKSGDSSWASIPKKGRIGSIVDQFRPRLDTLALRLYPRRSSTHWSLNLLHNSKLISAISEVKPDIINFHWIGDGFLPISEFRHFEAPLVWSLYDMWSFTGGCHYDDFCGKFVNKCGRCPQLDSHGPDISSLIWTKKK